MNSRLVNTFLVAILLWAGVLFLIKYSHAGAGLNNKVDAEIYSSPTLSMALTPTITTSPASTDFSLDKNIDIPFTSQAPFRIWDAVHEETCEEAAVIMAYAWIKNQPLTQEFVDSEITKLVRWEIANIGTYTETSARDTARMAREVYGLNPDIIENPTVEQIKQEIASNRIVIMGMAGRMLQNSNFTPPGPVYHMLLIRGYDKTGFYVNDDGTKRGENFHYLYENLIAAAHDWNGSKENLLNSPSVGIVFSK